MTLLKIYQLSVITSCVLFVAYWYAPWLYGYLDSESQGILAWGGHKSSYELPEWFSNAYLVIMIISYIGMLLLRKAFRTLFLILTIISFPIALISGMSVITGIEVVIIDISTLLSGFIIAIAYYSKLNEQFY